MISDFPVVTRALQKDALRALDKCDPSELNPKVYSLLKLQCNLKAAQIQCAAAEREHLDSSSDAVLNRLMEIETSLKAIMNNFPLKVV